MRLLFATGNAGKLRELRRMVAGLPVEVVSSADLPAPLAEVVEDGATFADNARKKAVEQARATGLTALSDDSGLCVDALGGEPGVRSARWSVEEEPGASGPARDLANNRKLLRLLQGLPDERRGARYVAVLVVAAPDGRVLATAQGELRGRVGHVARGRNGFGFDPLFLPEGCGGRSAAELSPEEKDAVSHRGQAFRQLRAFFEKLAVDESRREG